MHPNRALSGGRRNGLGARATFTTGWYRSDREPTRFATARIIPNETAVRRRRPLLTGLASLRPGVSLCGRKEHVPAHSGGAQPVSGRADSPGTETRGIVCGSGAPIFHRPDGRGRRLPGKHLPDPDEPRVSAGRRGAGARSLQLHFPVRLRLCTTLPHAGRLPGAGAPLGGRGGPVAPGGEVGAGRRNLPRGFGVGSQPGRSVCQTRDRLCPTGEIAGGENGLFPSPSARSRFRPDPLRLRENPGITGSIAPSRGPFEACSGSGPRPDAVGGGGDLGGTGGTGAEAQSPQSQAAHPQVQIFLRTGRSGVVFGGAGQGGPAGRSSTPN